MKTVASILSLATFAVASLSWAAIPAAASSDIVDTAVASKKFPTLVKALEAAGLVDTLKGNGPFTVFAPTEQAFRKLPKGTLESLLKPQNKAKLAAVLTYHVVPGKVMAADVMKLKNGTNVKTVQGETISIRNKHGVKVNNANVIKTDIECSNGVIHVIDTVILPKRLGTRGAANVKPGYQAGLNELQTASTPPNASAETAASISFPSDANAVDLRDGYTRVATSSYSIEVPTGWKVSAETRGDSVRRSRKEPKASLA